MPELQHMVLLAYGVDTASKTGGGERWALDARHEESLRPTFGFVGSTAETARWFMTLRTTSAGGNLD